MPGCKAAWSSHLFERPGSVVHVSFFPMFLSLDITFFLVYCSPFCLVLASTEADRPVMPIENQFREVFQ
jgi:hypothetical protein